MFDCVHLLQAHHCTCAQLQVLTCPPVNAKLTTQTAQHCPRSIYTLMLTHHTGVVQPQRFIRWETQRGCPFRCAFCQHRQAGAESLRRRQLSQSRIYQEVSWICAHPVIQDIAVLDRTFNAAGAAPQQVLQLLAEGGYTGKLALQCRLEQVHSEFLSAVQELNAAGAHCVLEFGLQTIHPAEQRIIQASTSTATASSTVCT
jgi:hypothetical protein